MEESKELQVAQSFLKDVQQKIDQFNQMSRQNEREKLAKQLLKGDLARANTEIDKATAKGEDTRAERAHSLFCEGLINLSVAESPEIKSLFTDIIVNPLMRNAYANNFIKKWATPAVAAFQKSAELNPSFQATYYNMGRAYFFLGNKAAATDAYTKAQKGDDKEVALEASKAISRMNEKKGPCFVATACYGDFDHPDVLALRRWRDNTLLESFFGKVFVACYYSLSPPIAARIAKFPRLANAIRRHILAPLVGKLK